VGLDINTSRGRVTLAQEARAITILQQCYPGVYVETNKDRPADIDYLKINDGVVSSVIEVKCRTCNRSTFENQFGFEWLVTADKVQRGCRVAKSLRCNFFGVLYLVPDDLVYLVWIYDGQNNVAIATARTEVTQTQRTVNGGKALRNNMFICMRNARVIQGASYLESA